MTEDAAASSSIASTTAARARAAHAALERVDEEIASEARPALSTIEREPRQKVNRHRVWHPTPKPPRRTDVRVKGCGGAESLCISYLIASPCGVRHERFDASVELPDTIGMATKRNFATLRC